MSVTPEGIFAEPMAGIREMIAYLTDWQAWTGSADAAEALDRIYLSSAPSEFDWPVCIIDLSDDFISERVGIQDGGHYQHDGIMSVWFSDDVKGDEDDDDAILAFINNYGKVWAGLLNIAAVLTASDYRINIQTIRHALPPTRTDPEHRESHGDFVEAAMAIRWKAVLVNGVQR